MPLVQLRGMAEGPAPRDTVAALMFRGLHPGGRARRALLVVLALCSLAGTAKAQGGEDEGSQLGWSMGAGCGLVLASMAVGGGISGLAEGDRGRRTGIEVVSIGMALGSGVSHAVAGEWKRAALFGGTALAIATFNVILIERSTAVLDHGPPESRIPFGIALATELLVTTVGLADSLMVDRRRPGPRVAVLPLLDRRALGLSLGGTL
jgi:hypothetical protein